MINSASILTSEKFNSFEELAEISVGWDADFRQLSAEDSKSELLQVILGSLLISDGYFGCHVEQRGSTPAGMRTFAVLEPDSPIMLWYQHVIGPDALLVFPAHREISVQSRPGFDVQTFSFPTSLLEEFFAQVGNLELGDILPDEELVIRPSAPVLNRIRTLIRQAPNVVKKPCEPDIGSSLVKNFRDELLFILLDALDSQANRYYTFQRPLQRSIRYLLEYIDSNIQQRLSVADLCTVANISERTLRNCFERQLGMSPKAYLMGKKLAGTHHELWQSQSNETLVSDVANKWGFWHMGQFAADYRKLFGELPSQTLLRNA